MVKDTARELSYHRALQMLGADFTNDAKKLVRNLQNEGIYFDEFLDMQDASTTRDFLDSYKKLAARFDIAQIQNKEDAIWFLLEYYIQNIADGKTNPVAGLDELITKAYGAYCADRESVKFAGDSHGIEHLIGLQSAYEDFLNWPKDVSLNGKYGDDFIKELEIKIIDEAKIWLKKYKRY